MDELLERLAVHCSRARGALLEDDGRARPAGVTAEVEGGRGGKGESLRLGGVSGGGGWAAARGKQAGQRRGGPSWPGSGSWASRGPALAWIRRRDVAGARRGLDPAAVHAGERSEGWLAGDGRKATGRMGGWGGVVGRRAGRGR